MSNDTDTSDSHHRLTFPAYIEGLGMGIIVASVFMLHADWVFIGNILVAMVLITYSYVKDKRIRPLGNGRDSV